jgi:hypothetical protein
MGCEFLSLALFTLCASFLIIPVSETAVRLAHMGDYRLFVYNENGQLVGPGQVISAANDDEAIAQAEALRGLLAAELLDFAGLRIVKRLPPNGSTEAASAMRAKKPRTEGRG